MACATSCWAVCWEGSWQCALGCRDTSRAMASPPGLHVQWDLRDVDSIVGDVFSVMIFHQPHEALRDTSLLLIVMDGEINAATNWVFVILTFCFLKFQH